MRLSAGSSPLSSVSSGDMPYGLASAPSLLWHGLPTMSPHWTEYLRECSDRWRTLKGKEILGRLGGVGRPAPNRLPFKRGIAPPYYQLRLAPKSGRKNGGEREWHQN